MNHSLHTQLNRLDSSELLYLNSFTATNFFLVLCRINFLLRRFHFDQNKIFFFQYRNFYGLKSLDKK